MFYQLYSIHGQFHGRSIPFLYALLPGKSENIYQELFDVLLEHVSNHPKSIAIDFEPAADNVIRKNLPGTRINACFFHFKQNLWRRIRVGIIYLKRIYVKQYSNMSMYFFLRTVVSQIYFLMIV